MQIFDEFASTKSVAFSIACMRMYVRVFEREREREHVYLCVCEREKESARVYVQESMYVLSFARTSSVTFLTACLHMCVREREKEREIECVCERESMYADIR